MSDNKSNPALGVVYAIIFVVGIIFFVKIIQPKNITPEQSTTESRVISTSENMGDYARERMNDSPTENSNVSPKENLIAHNICSECGNSVSNDAREYAGDVVSEYSPYYVCGDACQRQHILKKMRAEMTPNPTNEVQTGIDGRIYSKDACSLCNGTGIETATASNPATGVRERRVCPQCEGRGVESW
ncbi:MAG: hypothetical protein EOO50_05175 [Flavobacterium sp.]|uniref:hypothetical protein n=1 Tax=Flavobacterium sp. TaxID=239 RepID=UPI001200099E|nr:hypothetical protein [Flavobacterium sp.]RZJ67675.1 MAG: hypothetical protein EOO50_05175 [Flavobacterium sp.]